MVKMALRTVTNGLWTVPKISTTLNTAQGTCTVRKLSHSAASIALKDAENADNNVKPFSEIPGPRGLPYVGTLLQYKYGRYSPGRYNDALLERYHQYGSVYKETIAGRTVVHLFDPDHVSLVYQQEGRVPHIAPLMETTQLYRKTRGMSPGLGNTNGEEWYRLRSAVQQMMMRPKAVSMFLPEVNQVMDDLMIRMRELRRSDTGQVQDFKNLLMRWNLESSAMTCFETRLGCLDCSPDSLERRMLDANTEIFELSLKLSFSLPWYKLFSTPTWRKLLAAEDTFFGNGQRLVDRTVTRIKELIDGGRLEDGSYGFLTYLMARPELDYKDLSIITMSLFADGLSTTVPSLIGQIYCLATNQDKQQKLYEAVQEISPDRNQPITKEMIDQSQYLKACIKEGFRFFPIGVEVNRIPPKDMVIGGYHIPAGTHMELNNNLALRLPQYLDNPDEYRPERWVRGDSAETVHPYLLLPFGHGPRTCAGRRFAEQEMLVLLIRLLQNFRIEWPHKEEMRQRYCMLLTPDQPANFRFVPRS